MGGHREWGAGSNEERSPVNVNLGIGLREKGKGVIDMNIKEGHLKMRVERDMY